MKLVLLGPVGSGKGTQAGIISSEYNLPHISTGEIFRNNIKNETELGKIAVSIPQAEMTGNATVSEHCPTQEMS